LPDFSWYHIPKREKYTKWKQNLPFVKYQMTMKYKYIFNNKSFKNLPKLGFLVCILYHLATLGKKECS
jgi:hypothetical protein